MASRKVSAARDVWIRSDRWPDPKSLGRWARDCFRLEGARTPQEKALALWKWMLITMGRSGPPPHEGERGLEAYLMDTLKYLNVYGNHYCDGLSRLMITAWRASGCGRARKTVICRLGHTVAELEYRDADARKRWHVFDPRQGWYVFSRDGGHVASVAELVADPELLTDAKNPPRPYFYFRKGRERYRDAERTIGNAIEGMTPEPQHEMRLDLRRGERLTSAWAPGESYWPYALGAKPLPLVAYWLEKDSLGGGISDSYLGEHVIPYLYKSPRGAHQQRPGDRRPRCRRPGTVGLSYAVPLAGGRFREGALSAAGAVSEARPSRRSALLHPEALRRVGELVYEVRTPYVITDARVEATVRTGSDPLDMLGICVSVDGGSSWKHLWGNIFSQKRPSARPRRARATFGAAAYRAGEFSVVGKYGYLVRLDMLARRALGEVGFDSLKIITSCQCNMMALPALGPGRNRVSVAAKGAPRGARLRVDYEWDEKPRGRRKLSRTLPGSGGVFTVKVGARRPRDVRMRAVSVELV